MDNKIKKELEIDKIQRAYVVDDFKTEDKDDKKRVVGHAAVFNRETIIGGWFKEIIERGAFDNSDMTDVPLLVNHDLRKIPHARSRRNNGNSTMTLGIDDVGLMIDATLDTERNVESASLYSAISRGDISGMSFMFQIKEQKWENLDTEMPTRRILKIAKVYEVSAVTMPAYSDTDISARDHAALDSARQALERAKELESSEKREAELIKERIKLKGRY